jgi:DNA-binding transcriptional ArsR family regulator
MRVKHLGQICVGPTLTANQIRKVSAALKGDKLLQRRVKIHKILSGKTRYKIIKLLVDLRELCVCDMAEILQTSVSAVSHQLKLLRKESIVSTRRDGQTIYYSLINKEVRKLL